jgi:hypothetical protein
MTPLAEALGAVRGLGGRRTWPEPSTSAVMTRPSVSSDLLIRPASLARWSTAPDLPRAGRVGPRRAVWSGTGGMISAEWDRPIGSAVQRSSPVLTEVAVAGGRMLMLQCPLA